MGTRGIQAIDLVTRKLTMRGGGLMADFLARLDATDGAPAEDAALFRNVTRAHQLLSRRLRGAGLELEWAGKDKVIRARRGQPTARLTGLPGELLLFLFGRRDAADVEITGSSEAIEAIQQTPFGM